MANATAKAAPSTTENVEQYPPKHTLEFWKPNSSKKGAVAIFEFSPKKGEKEASFWLNMMPESGQDTGPKFNKEGKLTAKLGITDIGELLACLSGRNGGLGRQKDGKWSGIYHSNANGNTVINLNPNAQNQGHYWLELSVKRGNDTPTKLAIGFTPSDQELLLVFMRTYLPQMFIN